VNRMEGAVVPSNA